MTDAHPQIRGRRVLVTGASGFIGAHLCRRLLASGANLHAVSRSSRETQDGAHWRQADLSDFDRVRELMSAVRPDLVYHLASCVVGSRDLQMVLPTLQCNMVSAVNLMTAAAETGCQRVVLAGSLEEPQESNCVPSSPYAAAKWAASGYARMFHALYGLQIVDLRIAMVYGPDQADNTKLIPYVIQSLLHGKAPRLSSGQREVDWIYVDDVVDAMLASAREQNDACVTVDIGSGASVSIRDIVERICELVNPSIRPLFGALADRPCDCSWTADTQRAREKLGWQPSTELDAGLRKTVEWYRRAAARVAVDE